MARDVVFFVLIIVAAFTDVARGKVYNWLTLPAVGLGIGLNYVGWGIVEGVNTGWGPVGGFDLTDSLLGFAAGGGLFLIFFAKGWIGPGDVKLMAAVGALQGFFFVVCTVLLAACVGAVMALGWFIWQGRLWEGLKGSVLLLLRPKRFRQQHPDATTTIPYGLAIAVGATWAWLHLRAVSLW